MLFEKLKPSPVNKCVYASDRKWIISVTARPELEAVKNRVVSDVLKRGPQTP
jgi:hypothetical protein